ncbi:hypothetical protein [Autumnicola edwardsiae]|jgi:hypothetical protein|uniref:DUF4625 domain-containing protein n=1 Tax=Autumnicola edwardsiae TaxID=3075594 RepID=A0ABU3CT74_9FLAO|nr:hypothetical protein [Zunongwangia sp. F297]MDT0649564.1 hypothetical protein [Zunongwangia sp. F297]
MKKILILIIAITTLNSCSNDDDSGNQSEIEIRLSNTSQVDFRNVIVNTSNEYVEFGDIDTGQTTEYKIFETAYRYAFIELEIDGETYTIQPIDYVGETPLENGKYTYQIDANDSQTRYGKLNLTFVEE